MDPKMHNIDMATIEMTLDVMKYALNRITSLHPDIGIPATYESLKAQVGETVTEKGIGGEEAFRLFKDVLIKATIPIDHRKHLAFVPAAPSRAALMFDLVTAVSSIHGSYWLEGAGGIFCEMEAMHWLVSLTGMPEGSFGVFTSGGTVANLSALVVARDVWRNKYPEQSKQRGIVITSQGAHSSVESMVRVIDADLIIVPTEDKITGAMLEDSISILSPEDKARLFAVVATSGTTNAGIIDDLDSIADVCKEYDLWFHIDGAYGGAALAVPEMKPLFKGVEKCDSFTIDPHKWLFTPYDCGAIIYKKPELARESHSQKGSYLDIVNDEAANGFSPSEYQIQLTRRVRGLPLWFSLAMHGTKMYTKSIAKGIELANQAGKMIDGLPFVETVRPPSLSVVLFRRIGWKPEDYRNWTFKNQRDNFAFVTPTKWKNNNSLETVARFCFINPDTTEQDIQDILMTMS